MKPQSPEHAKTPMPQAGPTDRDLTLELWKKSVADERPTQEFSKEHLHVLAKDLHRSMPLTNVASVVSCLLMAWILNTTGHGALHISVWLLLGLGGSALRQRVYQWGKNWIEDSDPFPKTEYFLRWCVVISLLTGGMFGWGWWLISDVSTLVLMGYLFTHVAFLFGALYSYSTFIPAYAAYVTAGLLPATLIRSWDYFSNDRLPWGWTMPLGLGLIGALSLLFAYRSSLVFRRQIQLQERVFNLLEEVTLKRDEAIKATLAKSRFLASVSHDLRQPMHAINLYLASLARSYEQQMAQPQDLHSIEVVKTSISSLQESTSYLNSMFESLLDISRLDAGAVNVNIQHTSLLKLVAQLEMDYTHLAQAEGLKFDLRLPKQFHAMEVWTDPALLERLLRNLIVNAIRYTRSGGVRLSIVQRGKSLDFRVVDSGPGIEASMRQRIFEEFFQVPGSQKDVAVTSNTGRGIGLGLSIAVRLARRLHTNIRVHSHVGHGSVFSLTLPMRFVLKRAEEPTVDPVANQELPADIFVVLVDDDLSILRSTRLLLESFGIKVLTASTSQEAVQRLAHHTETPDLILSDWRLGAEDGLDCIARLRDEFNEEIPAILITGDTSIEHVNLFSESGLRVVHKPISGDLLITQIKMALNDGPLGRLET